MEALANVVADQPIMETIQVNIALSLTSAYSPKY